MATSLHISALDLFGCDFGVPTLLRVAYLSLLNWPVFLRLFNKFDTWIMEGYPYTLDSKLVHYLLWGSGILSSAPMLFVHYRFFYLVDWHSIHFMCAQTNRDLSVLTVS